MFFDIYGSKEEVELKRQQISLMTCKLNQSSAEAVKYNPGESFHSNILSSKSSAVFWRG